MAWVAAVAINSTQHSSARDADTVQTKCISQQLTTKAAQIELDRLKNTLQQLLKFSELCDEQQSTYKYL